MTEPTAYQYFIDVGYYSHWWSTWLPFENWLTTVPRAFLDQSIFLMDSGGVRTSEFPEYKSRRQERRREDPAFLKRAEKARQFRAGLQLPILSLATRTLAGYEADDLLALQALRSSSDDGFRFVGIDKDYAQLPANTIFLTAALGPHDPASHLLEKLPRYAQQLLERRTANRSFAIVQALTGDKSDSIPRLLSSRDRRGNARLLEAALEGDSLTLRSSAALGGPFEWPAFIRNLRLVTLPHPSLLAHPLTGEQLYLALVDGSYDRLFSN